MRPQDEGKTTMSALTALDHLLLGVADLDYGIEWVEQRTGVRAAAGGSHPGRGTRNALLALAGRQYLEIIAPDPAQDAAARSELRELREPRLVAWAAVTTDIGDLSKRISAAGRSSPGPRAGSRATPDGRLIKWTMLSVETAFGPGAPDLKVGPTSDPIPFFIEWDAASVHPSQSAPGGCELISLEFEHPDADLLRRTFGQIGIDATVRATEMPRIIATLKTPRGRVTLT